MKIEKLWVVAFVAAQVAGCMMDGGSPDEGGGQQGITVGKPRAGGAAGAAAAASTTNGDAGSSAAAATTTAPAPTGDQAPVQATPATPESVSGSRLRANRYVGADGSRQFAGTWHDTQLDIDCSFFAGVDGQVRCLPAMGAGAGLFADSGCSQPLAVQAKSACAAGSTPRYAGIFDACGHTSVYGVGQQVSPDTVYVRASATSCSPIPASTYSSTYDLFALGSPISADTFVAATISAE